MNANEELLRRADALQAQAQEVIANLSLRRLWGALGEFVQVGSSRFGLMTSTNLDFETYVDAPDPREGFAVVSQLAAIPGVRRIDYLNFLGTSDPGLYWHIFYNDQAGRTWDLDCWLVPYSHPHAGMADALARAMAATLTPESRQTILSIKRAVPKEAGYRGVDIYKAALKGGVRDAEGFLAWIKDNPPPEMETWTP